MGNVFLATITALSLGTTSVVATGSGAGCHYVDANGDGVCDYAGNTCSYVDTDGDGICDNYQSYQENCPVNGGANFVYTDSDDLYDNDTAGQALGNGNGFRGGCGRNYVDADSDGVCDNYAAGYSRGCGNGNGFRGGCGR